MGSEERGGSWGLKSQNKDTDEHINCSRVALRLTTRSKNMPSTKLLLNLFVDLAILKTVFNQIITFSSSHGVEEELISNKTSKI